MEVTLGGPPWAADSPRLPPRWFIRLFWWCHRRVVRLSGGRFGLWRPKPGKWGPARLTAVVVLEPRTDAA